MKKTSYLSSLAIFIASIVFTNTGFTQGGRTNPGDKFGKYQFEQKFKSSNGTIFQLSYGCGDISDAIDGIKKDYDTCDVKVDTNKLVPTRQPIIRFQNGFRIPSLGNAGKAAAKNGGQDSTDYVNMLKKIVDFGQVYMKELVRDSCDNKKHLEKLVYEIRCYKPDKGTFASAKWMADAVLVQQGVDLNPGAQPATFKKDSMTVHIYYITITCVCPLEPSEYEEEETFDPSFKSAGNAGSLSEELIIYPNPASSVINFSYPPANASDENLEIEVKLDVFNAYGQLIDRLNIHRFSYDANSLQLDVSTYSAGLYIYSLSVGQQTYRGQFVKD